MNKKDRIIKVMLESYELWTKHIDDTQDTEKIERLIDRNLYFKPGKGYEFYINHRYSAEVSHIADIESHSEKLSIGSSLHAQAWYIAGRVQKIEYKPE